MAPTIKEQRDFNEFRVVLLNFSRVLVGIHSLDALMTAKTTYTYWLDDLKDYMENNGFGEQTRSLFLNDEVLNHAMSGGAGVYFGDERSSNLLKALKTETTNKALILDKYYHDLFDVKRTIEKYGRTFNYCRHPIKIGEDSLPYHLLDILYYHADETGFISYEKVITEFKKRKKDGTLESKNITRKMISNAQQELFFRAKFSDENMPNATPTGARLIYSNKVKKGLIFNNEILN